MLQVGGGLYGFFFSSSFNIAVSFHTRTNTYPKKKNLLLVIRSDLYSGLAQYKVSSTNCHPHAQRHASSKYSESLSMSEVCLLRPNESEMRESPRASLFFFLLVAFLICRCSMDLHNTATVIINGRVIDNED